MTEKIKLFCIPYAGGSANIYNNWSANLPDNVELCPLELAGRGRRITEAPYVDLEAAVEDVFRQIADDIMKYDYAIFGHSMGALLTYEVTQKISSMGLPAPIHLFFSGRRPPGVQRRTKPFSSMSPREFEEGILALGGTPPEFFQYPELKKIFIPLLRSDFSISETIVERPEIRPLPTNISILLGDNEGIPPDISVKWKAHTQKECTIHYIEGGHFFLLDKMESVTDIIAGNLAKMAGVCL